MLAIAFDISPFRFSEVTIKDRKVSTYLRFGLNNINSSMAAAGLDGKSSRSSHIECTIVVGKSLGSQHKLSMDISRSLNFDKKSCVLNSCTLG